jgi:hypothetical protein
MQQHFFPTATLNFISVVDRHRNDADSDPDRHQSHTLRILAPALHVLEILDLFFTFSHSIASLQCFIFLINVKQMCHNFQYFGVDCTLKFSGKSLVYQLFHLNGIDTDPDLPNPDRLALDGDPDPDPAKLCGSDPFWIHIHNTAMNPI